MPPILPHFEAELQRIADARKIAEILLEADAAPPDHSNGKAYRRSADGHNRARRRGTADHLEGVSAAPRPGRDPASARWLAKEARGELRL